MNYENITNICELEDIILSLKFPRKPESEKIEILRRRKHLLDAEFKGTPEDIKHIERINNHILRTMHKVYDEVAKVKADLDNLISKGDNFYKNYGIDGHFSFELAYSEYNKQKKVLDRISLEMRPNVVVIVNEGEPMPDRVETLGDEINWDIEFYEPLRGKGMHIPIFMHEIFFDGHALAFSDMALINENDIMTFVEISL